MNPTVGSVQYDASIKLDQLKRDSKQAEAIAKGTGDSIGGEIEHGSGRASLALAKVAKMAKIATIAVGVAFAAATVKASKASWDQVAAVEQATVGLRAYERDGSKVNKVLEDLIAYARSDMGVLFNRRDLFQSAQMLKLNGVETSDLNKNVQILSRSVGLGLGNWQDLNSVVGRVVSTGRLTGIEFDQLTKSGFKLDKSLRNTNLSAEDLFKALDKGIPVDAMEGQANTIRGLGIRVETAFRGIGDAVLGVDADTSKFIAGGLGDRMTKGLANLTVLLKNVAPAMSNLSALFIRGAEKAGEIGKQVGEYLGPKLEALWNTLNKDLVPALKDFFENVIKPLIPIIGTVLVGAIGLVIDYLNLWYEAMSPVIRWLARNEKVVWGVVGAFLAFKGAMLLKSGFETVVDGLHSIKDAYGTVKDGIITAKDTFIKMKDKMVDTAKMVWHAVEVGAEWVWQAAKASAEWVLSMAKTLASMVLNAPKMIMKAADVGLAWTINAARVSFVWLTQTLPKLVIGFGVTAFKAGVHAVAVSAAWILSASKSAIAWTVTQLPRILAGFVKTSAQAATNALLTSAAWIASASKSAIAWVVTQLPKIIGAFVAMAASAALNAGKATLAWVGSAATTSKSFAALKLLVATPMVMPAIVVLAALAAVAQVARAIQGAIDLKNTMDRALSATKDAGNSEEAFLSSLKRSRDEGKITSAEHNRRFDEYMAQRNNYMGTNNWKGGPTWVGERGPEIIDLPKGSRVIPNHDIADMAGGGIENNIGTINIATEADGEKWLRKLTKNQEITSAGLTPVQGWM